MSILDPAEERGQAAADGGATSDKTGRRMGAGGDDNDIWAPRWDELPERTLRPLEMARVTLDFRAVPAGFEYNDHYALIVLGSADGEDQ
jgi:hypothetical protein